MSTPICSCYEIREIWGEGCPNPGCPLSAAPAKPVPCHHWAKQIQPPEKPESPPVIEPGKQPKRRRP